MNPRAGLPWGRVERPRLPLRTVGGAVQWKVSQESGPPHLLPNSEVVMEREPHPARIIVCRRRAQGGVPESE